MYENNQIINEVSYLCVPNARIYRSIIRICFNANQNYRYHLYKEEIFNELRKDPLNKDYTIDNLKNDLDQLVTWGNLIAMQDPGVVHSIVEYKNKQFRYSMSEQAVEIERLTIRLENLEIESASLSTNHFVKIENLLLEAKKISSSSSNDIYDWWHDLQDVFKNLNQNYQDYLRDFYIVDVKILVKILDFVNHKELFTLYLKEFIQQMQMHSRKIQKLINENDEYITTNLLDKVIQSEIEVPRIKQNKINVDDIRKNVNDKYSALKSWFISENDKEAEYLKVLNITNDIIRNIIDKAATIASINNYGYSRKDDYQKFIELFLKCQNLNEAHRLAAHFFGIQEIRHFKLLRTNENNSFKESVYRNDNGSHSLTPSLRTARERKEKEGFKDKSADKEKQKQKYLLEADIRRQSINKYIKDGKLVIGDIQEKVPGYIRETLLSWITNANINENKFSNTDYGQRFKLIKKDGTITLKCDDGNIQMPNYEMEFIEE